jgi:6-phosphogluconolactonase
MRLSTFTPHIQKEIPVTFMKISLLSRRAFAFLLGALALPVAALAGNGNGNDSPGTVYTLSNAAAANRVLTFDRDAHGDLTAATSYATGGRGTGAGLGSQGALALSDNGQWLLAVNAGSNDLSVFSVRHDALVLTDVVPSGGLRPISVTIADNLVYVLNAGGAVGSSDNISGFSLTSQGKLIALPGSTRALSAANTGPAQISFALGADALIVTEKATSRVDTFVVDANGIAGPVNSMPSAGAVPFGFAVSAQGGVFVSEAVASALSSYALNSSGTLDLISPSVINHQAAACWVALSKDERFAYTANAASNSLSAYRINGDGSLSLVESSGFSAAATHPLDLTVSHNGRFLYALTTGGISIYDIGSHGSLNATGSIPGLPASAAGLVAR